MRKTAKNGTLSVQAIAGTYVVLLGINLSETATEGVLGFAIERTDYTEDERYWLRGFKTFGETSYGLGAGSLVSTSEQPIQAFLWGDFTAKPDHAYAYRIVVMRGKPKKLEMGESVEVQIATEDETSGNHAVYFNRGVAGSQAYVRQFQNRAPDRVAGDRAWKWLSRGLVEALLAFIGQAKDSQYSLRAALYEFQYEPVLKAFGAAAQTGADVKIVFDAKPNSGNYPNQANREAIAATGIELLTVPRTVNPSYIAHNKFILLLKDNQPIQVWTGSTNITDGGIYGHSNVGHIVRDSTIAASFLAYWEQLHQDLAAKDLRPWTNQHSPTPVGDLAPDTIAPIYSPRPNLSALEWYVDRMDTAQKAIFFTAAFGVNDMIEEVLSADKDYLRYVLLEKEGGDIESLRRDPDNRIAVGSTVRNTFDRWQQERTTGLNTHVRFIHTKYLLVDPLSDNPLTITGSANFSDASTKNNDENMLLIQGDRRVADIYLGEFMRLFQHFYFRYLASQGSRGRSSGSSYYLKPNNSWLTDYYIPGSPKFKERLYFAGEPFTS